MIVIQHNNKICFQRSRIIQSFIRHAASQGAIPDYGNDIIILPPQFSRLYISKPGRNGGGAVTGIKCIAFTFCTLWKTTHSAIFAQTVKSFFPSCQKLMGIGLMSHIPDNSVLGQGKYFMHRHSKLHNSKIRSKMASGPADFLYQELPDFPRQDFHLIIIQFFDIIRLLYPFQHNKDSLFFPVNQLLNQPFQIIIFPRQALKQRNCFF